MATLSLPSYFSPLHRASKSIIQPRLTNRRSLRAELNCWKAGSNYSSIKAKWKKQSRKPNKKDSMFTRLSPSNLDNRIVSGLKCDNLNPVRDFRPSSWRWMCFTLSKETLMIDA